MGNIVNRPSCCPSSIKKIAAKSNKTIEPINFALKGFFRMTKMQGRIPKIIVAPIPAAKLIAFRNKFLPITVKNKGIAKVSNISLYLKFLLTFESMSLKKPRSPAETAK